MNQKEKIKLKRFINELSQIRGRHTELVSVYIPVDYDLQKIINHLQQEQSTASNIKDSRTRKNVQDSLDKAIRHLKLYKKTPKNGLAVFAGNSSDNESKITIEVWSVEPPQPLNFRLYRCDQNFLLDPLKDLLESRDIYGLVVLDRREATIGVLKGTYIEQLMQLTSGVPGKTKAGGQSAARFARIREGMAKEFYNRIGEAVNKTFLEMEDLKGIILGGPGPTKEDFLDGSFMNNEIKKKVIGVKDLGYTGEFGLNELVDNSQDLLAKEEIAKQKIVLTEFFENLAKETKKAVYGEENVNKVLKLGAVEKLLLSEDLGDEVIEKYEEEASKMGTKTIIISKETREGIQLKDLGGIAAILRYAV